MRSALLRLVLLAACALASACGPAHTGNSRPLDWANAPILPAGVQLLANVAYGTEPRQQVDVYRPSRPSGPVLVMVHGGGWRRGHKAMPSVVEGKLGHWVVKHGWILVSVGYRLSPEAHPSEQAIDVAHAVSFIQQRARHWGGDPDALVVMGHSAGGHLSALISTSEPLRHLAGAYRWPATVILDGAAFDPAALLQEKHVPIYYEAFGPDPAAWGAASPTEAISANSPPVPMLIICSLLRPDDACAQSQRFADRVRAVGGKAEVLPLRLDHMQVNGELGRSHAYTAAVDDFLASQGLPMARAD